MTEENNNQKSAGSSQNKEKKIDLDELAKKIVALLLRELDIERERTGR